MYMIFLTLIWLVRNVSPPLPLSSHPHTYTHLPSFSVAELELLAEKVHSTKMELDDAK